MLECAKIIYVRSNLRKHLTQTCSFVLIKVISVSTHTKVGANCIYTHLFTTMLFCSTFINIYKYKEYFFKTSGSDIWVSNAFSSFFLIWKYIIHFAIIEFNKTKPMLVWPFLFKKKIHCRHFQKKFGKVQKKVLF